MGIKRITIESIEIEFSDPVVDGGKNDDNLSQHYIDNGIQALYDAIKHFDSDGPRYIDFT